MGGLMWITGDADGPPMKAGPGVGDLFPATLLCSGVLAALIHARSTGEGQFVDVAMYGGVIALCERIVYQNSLSGTAPTRQGNTHPILSPYGVYECSDGWVAVAAPTDAAWKLLSELIGRPEVAADPRFATTSNRRVNSPEVDDVLSAWTRGQTASQVVQVLGGRIPVGRVNSMAEIAADPHVRARSMVVHMRDREGGEGVAVAGCPIKMTATSPWPGERAPQLGEHTSEILAELGCTNAEITDLRRRNIVG